VFEEGLTIAANLATDGFKKGTKEIEKAVKTLSNSVKRFGTQMTSKIRGLIPMIIGVGSAYGIISKGVSAFMSQNEELSQRMNAIWTAVGNLLGPIITQIIEWVSTAVSYFLGFLKLLGVTGKSASDLSTKANKSVKELQRTLAGFDELNVLQDNSSNGNNNNKQNPLKDLEPTEWMKKLAELLKNKMWDEAADLLVEKINGLIHAFQEKAFELGDAIGEYLGGALHIFARLINDIDWQGLGDGIAKFVNGVLKNIDGKDLGTVLVGKFIIAFGILTGFLAGLDWEQTANVVIDAIIGIFESLGDAIAEADFQKIGEGIRTFFEKIWERKDEIAQAIFGFLREVWEAALDLLNGLLGGTDEQEHPVVASLRKLGETIKELSDTVSPILEDLWHNILEPLFQYVIDERLPQCIDTITNVIQTLKDLFSGDIGLAEFIGRIVGMIVKFYDDIWNSFETLLQKFTGFSFEELVEQLWENIKAAWQNLKDWWHEVAFEDGKFCIEGLFEGIIEKIKGIGDWIKEHVIDPFVNGFKTGLGIHSPSTVMADMGRNIIQGLINGVTELLPNLDTIKENISKAWTGLKETISGWWDSVKGWFTGADKTSESADGMETSLNNASGAASDSASAIQTASEAYAEAYSAIATSASDAAQAVETSVTKIKDDTSTNFDTTSEKVKTSSEEMKTNVVTSLQQLNAEAENELNMLSTTTGTIFTQLATNAMVWGSDLMIEFINGINARMPDLVNTLVGVAQTVDSYIGFSLPDKGPLSDFDKSGPDMVDLFAEGMEGKTGRLTEALNAIAENVSYRTPGIAGGALLPYAVAAASGGESAGGDGDDLMERLFELISGLEDAILNGQFVIDFGDFRAIAKKVTKIQRQMQRAEGV